MKSAMPTEGVKCSFCGKHQDEVRRIIAGPNVYICDECVDLCSEIIEQECEARGAPRQASTSAKVTRYLHGLHRVQAAEANRGRRFTAGARHDLSGVRRRRSSRSGRIREGLKTCNLTRGSSRSAVGGDVDASVLRHGTGNQAGGR